MNLSYIYDTLKSLGLYVVYGITNTDRPPPYIVYAIDSQVNPVYADNRMYQQQLQGTIDLFTTEGLDLLSNQLTEALTIAGIRWKFGSEQYEPDERIWHYEWIYSFLEDRNPPS